MAQHYRLTQSGACASCGAYGGNQHRPTCQPDVKRVIQLQYSRQARRDAQTSAAVRATMAIDRALTRKL